MEPTRAGNERPVGRSVRADRQVWSEGRGSAPASAAFRTQRGEHRAGSNPTLGIRVGPQAGSCLGVSACWGEIPRASLAGTKDRLSRLVPHHGVGERDVGQQATWLVRRAYLGYAVRLQIPPRHPCGPQAIPCLGIRALSARSDRDRVGAHSALAATVTAPPGPHVIGVVPTGGAPNLPAQL